MFYTVSVIGGTADKESATMGEVVTLTPDVPDGLKLIEWLVKEGEITIENNSFVMPASNVVVEALYNVGIEESEIGDLNVYPNPASDYIRVSGLENMEYRIIGSNGVVVLSGSNYSGESIDVSHLSAGMYFLFTGNRAFPFLKK